MPTLCKECALKGVGRVQTLNVHWCGSIQIISGSAWVKAHSTGLHRRARLHSNGQAVKRRCIRLIQSKNTKSLKNAAIVKSSDDIWLSHGVATVKPCCASVDAKDAWKRVWWRLVDFEWESPPTSMQCQKCMVPLALVKVASFVARLLYKVAMHASKKREEFSSLLIGYCIRVWAQWGNLPTNNAQPLLIHVFTITAMTENRPLVVFSSKSTLPGLYRNDSD